MSEAADTNGKWIRRGRRALAGGLILLCAAFSYQTVSFVRVSRAESARRERAARAAADTTPPVNPFASVHGKNLIAYIITASDCGWSQRPATMQAVSQIRNRLKVAHGSEYAAVTVIGVAIDKDPTAGLDFLAKIAKMSPDGAFDQVMAGGSWLNEELVRLLWRDALIEGASPQVLLIERQVASDQYLKDWTLQLGSDRVLANPSGSNGIVGWIGEGLPLHPATTAADTHVPTKQMP